MYAVLWLIAVILVIWGIVMIARGALVLGIILIILGLIVGPGGVSIFHNNDLNNNGAPAHIVEGVVT